MPSKYQKFMIEPRIGIGPIQFGMPQKKIEKILVNLPHADLIRVHYSNELTCNGIEFHKGSQLYLDYFWLTGTRNNDFNQVIAYLLLLDPKLQIKEDSILSENLCLYVKAIKDQKSDLLVLGSVHVFSPEVLSSYQRLQGNSHHSRTKDFIGKINQEGMSLFGLSMLMICGPLLWFILSYVLGLNTGGQVFSRYFGWQDSEGFWLALILIGLLLLLIHSILWLKRSSTILYKSPYEYVLSKQRSHLYMDVLYGTVAQHHIKTRLTPEQRREFWRRGVPFLDAIAENIRNNKKS